jgi:hypothetical protein
MEASAGKDRKMIEPLRPPEGQDAAEQSQAAGQTDEVRSKEANARADADAQVKEQVEDHAAPTLVDIGSLED